MWAPLNPKSITLSYSKGYNYNQIKENQTQKYKQFTM